MKKTSPDLVAPSDDVQPEYKFDYAEARPNRFADPAHPVEPDSWVEAVRKGLIQPAESTAGVPPRIPAVPFDDLMRDLKRDREDR
jgi:hypothetical protein